MNFRDSKNQKDGAPFPTSVFPEEVFPRRIFPWMRNDTDQENYQQVDDKEHNDENED